MDFFELARSRWSVRSFQDKPIEMHFASRKLSDMVEEI